MKYIVVTGARGGMGRESVKRLTELGYIVFALDNSEAWDGERVIPIVTDVTNSESVRGAAEKIAEITNEIFAIVHFAGVYRLDSLVEMSEDRFVSTFDINLFGVYRINKALLPLLRQGSRIVITTSELAPLDPLPFTGIYAITKSALEKYAYSLRMELQLLGISVTVLRPGAVKTALLNASKRELDEFVEKTEIYKCNAKRFKRIVESVEAKNVEPCKVALTLGKIISAKRPRYLYNLNRNPLLRLLNALPKKVQTKIISIILK